MITYRDNAYYPDARMSEPAMRTEHHGGVMALVLSIIVPSYSGDLRVMPALPRYASIARP